MSQLPPNGRKSRIALRPGRKRGKQYLWVAVHRGYITISEGDYNHPDYRPIYIPKHALIPLLKWLVPLVKEMDTDFDPVLAAREQEELSDSIKRQRRKLRRSPRRRKRLRREADDE